MWLISLLKLVLDNTSRHQHGQIIWGESFLIIIRECVFKSLKLLENGNYS